VLLTWISPFPFSRKQSARLFRKFPGTNGSSLPHSPEKGVTSRGIPTFSEISKREYFRSMWFSSLNFRDFRLSGLHFRNSTISDSRITFAKNSLSIPYLHSLSHCQAPRALSIQQKIFGLPFSDIYSDDWNSIFWNSTEDKSLACSRLSDSADEGD